MIMQEAELSCANLVTGQQSRGVWMSWMTGTLQTITPEGLHRKRHPELTIAEEHTFLQGDGQGGVLGMFASWQTLQLAHDRLQSMRRHRLHDAAGVVLCLDLSHALKLADLLKELAGEPPALAIGGDAARSIDRLTAFQHGPQQWLITDQPVQGLVIPRLKVLVYLTTTATESFVRQAIGQLAHVRPQDPDGESFHADCYFFRSPHVMRTVDRLLGTSIASHSLSDSIPEPEDSESLEGDLPPWVTGAEKVAALAKRYDLAEDEMKNFLDDETARVRHLATKFTLSEERVWAMVRDLRFMHDRRVIEREVEATMALQFDLPESVVHALFHDFKHLKGDEDNEDQQDQEERNLAVRLAREGAIPLVCVMLRLKAQREYEEPSAGLVSALAGRYGLSFATVTKLLRSARRFKDQLQIQGCMSVPELREKLRFMEENPTFLKGDAG